MSAPSFSVGGRPSSCLVTHFQPSRDDGSAAGGAALHATVELWSMPAATPAASFHVTSTVKSGGDQRSSFGGGVAGGRIDLLSCFGSFAAATFADSNRLAIYSLRTHAKHNQSTLPERARCMVIDQTGRFLLLGSATGWLRIYCLATGSLVRQLRTHHDRGINCMQIDAQAQMLVLGGEDGVISVYDFAKMVQQSSGAQQQQQGQQQQGSLSQSALLLSISDHSLAITSLTISASKYLLSSSKDGSVRVYKLEQPMAAAQAAAASSSQSIPAPPCLFHHSFRSVVSAATMDASESIIYAACKENIHWVSLYPSAVALGRAAGGAQGGPAVVVHTWRGHLSNVTALLLPPSSSHLVSLDAEGNLKLWDAGSPCGSAPPAQGSCVKNLGRRPGCKNLAFVDAKDLSQSATPVATANTWLASHASKAAQGAGLSGKDSGWIFPPLNAHPPSPFVFVGVPLAPLAVQNQELKQVTRSSKRRRAFGELSSAAASSLGGEESLRCDAASPWLKRDWEMVQGTSGWSSLAEAASTRGTTVELLQNQVDTFAGNLTDMYALCVDKIWKDIKQPQSAADEAR